MSKKKKYARIKDLPVELQGVAVKYLMQNVKYPDMYSLKDIGDMGIMSSFNWGESKEGHDFWENECSKILDK